MRETNDEFVLKFDDTGLTKLILDVNELRDNIFDSRDIVKNTSAANVSTLVKDDSGNLLTNALEARVEEDARED